ncbi:nucleotidyltransferase [soil metagenome]
MVERLRRAAASLPHDAVATHRGDLLRLAEQHGIFDVRLFGSVARQTDNAGSDVDLLVRVPPRTGLMTLSSFALEAESLLGVRVDVVTEGGLRADHPIRREAVSL